jgi:hypothetical protein
MLQSMRVLLTRHRAKRVAEGMTTRQSQTAVRSPDSARTQRRKPHRAGLQSRDRASDALGGGRIVRMEKTDRRHNASEEKHLLHRKRATFPSVHALMHGALSAITH